jgi:uncharacterized membrane protein YdbT with pleckstrin-like domain
MILRPSLKFIKLSYTFCLVLAVALGVYLLVDKQHPEFVWAFLVPGFFLVVTMVRHVERRLVKLEILGDRLRYESGFLAKTTRTIELVKVQEVTVHQTFGQRLANLGDLQFETAGKDSGVVMHSVDNPQPAADHILALAKSQRAHPLDGSIQAGTA